METGANLLAFFTLPFAALLGTVARADFPDFVPRALAALGIGLATLFALVGLWQAATRELFFYAPNLAVSNANSDYFRVTSLFGDPSLYGRHVVLGIGIALALLVTQRWRTWPLVGLVVVMWAGLLFSYSQSSMAALLVVTLALALATGDRRVRRAVGLLALVAVIGAGAYVAVRLVDGADLNRITSDRTERVEDTARVIDERPVAGVGIGGQPRASRRAGRQHPAHADLRLAHDPAHRRGGAGPDRAGAVRLAAGRRGAADRPRAATRRGVRAGARRFVPRAVRARAVLQRVPRGSAHLAGAGRGGGLAVLAAGADDRRGSSEGAGGRA